MSNVEAWVLAYLLNSAWQVPLLFAAAWLAARALRPVGAAAEHRVWVGSLVLQSLLPALSAMPWAWLRTLSIFSRHGDLGNGAQVAVIINGGTALSGHGWSSPMLTALAVAYCVVTAYFAGRLLWQAAALSALARKAAPVELAGQSARLWQHCSTRFGVSDVALASFADARGPMTMGCFRKVILVPATMLASISPEDFQTIIAHEFAHVSRNDFARNLMYEFLALAVSYHPLSWLTRTRIAESREMVCDQLAAQVTGRKEYTQSLLRLAASLVQVRHANTLHAIGIFDAHIFERRLMKLTESKRNMRGARRAAIVTLCGVLGIGTCVSALALRVSVQTPAAGSQSGATSSPKHLTVDSGVMAGNKLTGRLPEYPASAKEGKIQGTVVLSAVIDKDGAIKDVRAVSGPKQLQESSLDAVRQWTYKPYLLNGDPVEVQTTVKVIFSLGK